MKYCSNCGKELTKDGFCSNCGSNSSLPGMVIENKQKKVTEEIKINYCVECGCKNNNGKIYCDKCLNMKRQPSKKNDTKSSRIGFSIAGFICSFGSLIVVHFLKPHLLSKCGDLCGLGNAIDTFLRRTECLILLVLGLVFSIIGINEKNKQIGLLLSGIGVIICILSFLLCFNIIPIKVIPI